MVDWIGKDANGSLPGVERVAKPGFWVGLIATLSINRLLSLGFESFHLSLQPEVLYATKGSNVELNGEYRATTSMAYVQTGLLFRAEYAMTERINPHFVFGPALGLLRSVGFKNQSGETTDTKDDYKATDFSLILGLGAMYELPPYGSLGLELRGDLGLVSIDGQGDGDEIRNAALTLLLVYLY
jgi:opacity protein-like surface antigen